MVALWQWSSRHERPSIAARIPSAAVHVLGDRALGLAAHLAVLQSAALVAHVLAAGEGDLDLRVRALEVHARGDERQAALLGRAGQAVDLAAVQEQLARALRLVVLARRRRVRRYVGVV